ALLPRAPGRFRPPGGRGVRRALGTRGFQRHVRGRAALPRAGGGRVSASTPLVIFGALGREDNDIADRRNWPAHLSLFSPPLPHLHPQGTVEGVGAGMRKPKPRYQRLVVVYGDCGPGGRLDPVLDEVGALRLRGPHCYEMFAGAQEFERLMNDQPGTFFLTDWLVRSFERAVIRGLGLDRFPDLRTALFANYQRLIYLRQFPSDGLLTKANASAAYLELPLEARDLRLGEL